jgi:arylsulfatase A
MLMRLFLLVALSLISLTAVARGRNDAGAEESSGGARPNIVLIMADDVSPDMFGCYGSEDAKTPNIDRMAEEGVQFGTAWASALCGPARKQILTGLYASRTGVWSNGLVVPLGDDDDSDDDSERNFGHFMQAAGYATAVAGKWHVPKTTLPSEPNAGFDEYCLWESQGELNKLPGALQHEGAWEDADTTSRYWHPCIVRNHELVETASNDFGPDIFTDFLCDFMERSISDNKPFLAYYPMVAPHGTREGHTTCPLYGEVGDMAGERDDLGPRFRALINYMDILIGRLQEKVRTLGVEENTIFIFCADNGTAVTAKSRGVERGCRVPFIACGAGIENRGVTDEICDLSDILPTLVDLADAGNPEEYASDGVSLKPFLTGQSDSHRDYIFACIGGTRLVRSRTHMLEVVCPILDVPEGRFYFYGDSYDGRGYVRAENDPAHADVRVEFERILDSHPGLDFNQPYFQRGSGLRWLDAYSDPAMAEKHLHNHRDYSFYDETLE